MKSCIESLIRICFVAWKLIRAGAKLLGAPAEQLNDVVEDLISTGHLVEKQAEGAKGARG